MKLKGMKIRWLNAQCFEMKLPNGKYVLTDPCVSKPLEGIPYGAQFEIPGFTVDDIEGADYIIVNHTHGDHILDLGTVAKKFNSLVICHTSVAMEVCRFFDLHPTNVYPVDYEGTYYFDDFTLQTFHGMHQPSKKPISQRRDTVKDTWGREGYHELGCYGSMFNMNWVMTTNENLKVGFFAGDYFKDTMEKWRSIRPNILLRHRRKMGPKAPQLFIRALEETGAQLLLPMHHEDWLYEDPEYAGKVMEEVNRAMEEKGLASRMFNPERAKWYDINLGIDLSED
ncbi:MAG: MBL fold metallo-hydrolase [Clostridium sp.]|nr:MBL fold metallo-hydrolase [Clostridium sp.]